MQIALVTNLYSRGLLKDAMLLRGLLVEREHDVAFVQYDNELIVEYDLLVFLETIVPEFVPLSKHAPLFFVNPEFLFERDFPLIKSSFGKVLCKTHEAHRICNEVFGEQAVYTGFLAEDKLRPGIEKEARFLHIAGKSSAKNSLAVVDSWRWRHEGKALDADLTVVADQVDFGELPDRVTLLSNISEEALTELQNRCMFHLQPSATEGFGHVLWEALSVNALLITTGRPPMMEIENAYFLAGENESKCRMATVYEVSPLDIHLHLKDIAKWDIKALCVEQAGKPRKEFLAGNETFKKNFAAVLDYMITKPAAPVVVTQAAWTPRPEGELQIAFLGNFDSPESTENMISDALCRGLRHNVFQWQENRVSLTELRIHLTRTDLFIWVRTPGWLTFPDEQMCEFLLELERAGVPTLAIHLDKFWGIPEREALIGKLPFWKCKYVFTADGSRPADFKARGVNHFWMKPAVSEVYCHPGFMREEYQCDVGFVGAREYHSEYPFRPKLVDFLQETYGSRFKHIPNVRGHALNDFYASCKVAVADCIFAGTPNYWSDRAPETIGRGGFLLHPGVEGFDIPTGLYKAQDLVSLKSEIDYFLGNEKPRIGISRQATRHVAAHDTWTHRMQWILETVTK